MGGYETPLNPPVVLEFKLKVLSRRRDFNSVVCVYEHTVHQNRQDGRDLRPVQYTKQGVT